MEPGEDTNLEGEITFMQLLGLRFEEMSPSKVVASVGTGTYNHQPGGLVHGGLFTAVIETATTDAYLAVKDQNQVAVGLNHVTDFLRSRRQGRLRIGGELLQRGKVSSFGRWCPRAKTIRLPCTSRFDSSTSRRRLKPRRRLLCR